MEVLINKSVKSQNKEIEYRAYYIANTIDISAFKKTSHKKLISSSASELYYQYSKDKYVLILNYGLIVFTNFDEIEINTQIEKLKPFTQGKVSQIISDELIIIIKDDSDHFEMTFDFLSIGRFDNVINKAIMLNLAQSVCLNQYTVISQQILMELKNSTVMLGKSGKIKLNQREAMRLAGRSLSAKNAIAENLYILDNPEITWEEEFIDRLHKTLARHFELRNRYQSLENTFKIIEDNLNLYIGYNHHRESSRLEWIIIILIVIEVLDTFASKLFF